MGLFATSLLIIYFQLLGAVSLNKKSVMLLNIIDEKGTSLLFSFEISETISKKQQIRSIGSLIRSLEKFQRDWPKTEFHFLGTAVANYYFTVEMVRNQTVITPLLLLSIGIFMFLMLQEKYMGILQMI